jgi:predicted TIM-barrel fold metal-dependent hydrolase
MCLHHRITRRRAIGTAVAAVATALVGARAVRAAGPYEGPLVDAHSHLKGGIGPTADELIRLYDGAGVRGVLLFGEPWPVATATRDLAPGRIVPLLAEGYANALHRDSSYVNAAGLEQVFAANVVRGLGEIICRHSPYRLGAAGGFASAPANDVPADHPALLAAYRLTGAAGGVVTIHQEWWFADELERAVRAAPDTPFIWAHAGHGDVDVVRRMLARNPNLHADLSARSPWLGPGTVLTRADGSLSVAWAALLREHADRFLVGFDLFVPAHYQDGYAAQMVGYYRGLLGQLEPDVAAMIAYGNAARLAPFAAS